MGIHDPTPGQAARAAHEGTRATGQGLRELPTPALVVDLDAFEHNLAAADALARSGGKWLRPHVKTHRTPGLALRQLGGAARGVTCATVGEAEAMVASGIDDVLLANEIVTRDKIQRLARLAHRARVLVAVDTAEPMRALAAAATRQEVTLEVLIDVDVGLGRCGVRSPAAARTLAAAVPREPSLRLAGIMGYEGRLRQAVDDRDYKARGALDRLAEVKDDLERAGLGVEVVSAAGTSTLHEALAHPVVTELQVGTYAFMEADLDGLHLPFRHALTVLATVISRSTDRAVLDAGRKTIGCDSGLPQPVAAPGRTDWSTVTVSEEHILLACPRRPPPLGARVALRPSHVRTTFNLHDQVWLARGDKIVEVLPVTARGRSQ